MRIVRTLGRMAARARRRSLRENAQLGEAWLELTRQWVAMTLVPYERWSQRLVFRGEPATAASPGADVKLARAMAERVAVASKRHPLETKCLHQSLALHSMLARRGIPTDVRLGVRRGDEGVEAHAWVELGGVSLEPDPDAERPFRPFSLSLRRR